MKTLLSLLARNRVRLLVVISVFMSAGIALAVGRESGNIEYVRIEGDIDTPQRAAVRELLTTSLLESGDIRKVKGALEAADWIFRARIGYEWPDTLAIRVVPEVPIAYWNDDGFINQDGIVLHSDHIIGGDLPRLRGPAGSEKELMHHYRTLGLLLMDQGRSIEAISMNQRRGISLETDDGVLVMLGNMDIKTRLQRYLAVAAQLPVEQKIRRVDARYSKGVAVLADNTETLITQARLSAEQRDEFESAKREEL